MKKTIFNFVLLLAIAAGFYFVWSLLRPPVSNTPSILPDFGQSLSKARTSDEAYVIDTGTSESRAGTAFALSGQGQWATARHVVDGCDAVYLSVGRRRYQVSEVVRSLEHDTAILTAPVSRQALPNDFGGALKTGDYAYVFGFPQGQPAEVVARLLGRKRLIVRGRYDSVESVLSWMEAGRTEGFFGVLQGLSGAPVLDSNGRVIGVFSVETRDQGRIISVAPENLKDFLPASSGVRPEPIIKNKFSRHADNYRRDQRIVEVRCEMR